MAFLIQGDGIGDVWHTLLSSLIIEGIKASPREMETLELTNVTLEIRDGLNNIIVSPKRDLNYRFMIAEWLWIKSGCNDVDSIAKYNSQIRRFSDNGAIFNGAYGPRLAPQWDYILATLKKPDTRQAVAAIWTPNPQESKDIPCTISLQFLIRDDCVNLTVNMRSSDAWLGLPYDFFTFSQLMNMVATWIELPPGSVTMNLASSHLYKDNWIDTDRVLEGGDISSIHSPLASIPMPHRLDLKAILLYPEQDHSHLGEPWASYAKALRGNKQQALEVLVELSTK